MPEKYTWRIKERYFQQLKNGSKHLEIRVGYSWVKKVKPGDIIIFENCSTDEFYVSKINRYDSFNKMLQVENVNDILPGLNTDGALSTLQKIYPPNKESLGVYVFTLNHQCITDSVKIISASNLLKSNSYKEFSQLVYDSYKITDWIRKDYPLHCLHFYNKYVPGISCSKRNIISCYVNNRIVATAFLKREDNECKISTLYVLPDYRGKGIATILLQNCFSWLGTEKPLITIADYKLNQFNKIINTYGWKETQVLDRGYYNCHSREHVFNGII